MIQWTLRITNIQREVVPGLASCKSSVTAEGKDDVPPFVVCPGGRECRSLSSCMYVSDHVTNFLLSIRKEKRILLVASNFDPEQMFRRLLGFIAPRQGDVVFCQTKMSWVIICHQMKMKNSKYNVGSADI